MTLATAVAALTASWLSAASARPLDALAERLAPMLGERCGSAALYVRGSTPALSRGAVTALLGRLGAGRTLVELKAESPELAEAAARAQALRCLVRVDLSIEGDALVARGDVLSTWVNFWSGNDATRAAEPAAVIALELPVDAATLALAAPSNPPSAAAFKLSAARLAQLSSAPVAVAAGDLDGDGVAEVAVLTEDEVVLLSREGKGLARFDLTALPLSRTPCREPLGALAIVGPRVAFFSARRAHGMFLAFRNGKLEPMGALERPMLGEGIAGAWLPGQNAYAALSQGETAWRGADPVVTVSARTHKGLGQYLFVLADGTASLTQGWNGVATRWKALGAGSALADLDGDGRPEVVTSAPAHKPKPESLRVLRGPDEPPAATLELGETRVLAVAGAELNGAPGDELLVGAWSPDGKGELLLVQRTAP